MEAMQRRATEVAEQQRNSDLQLKEPAMMEAERLLNALSSGAANGVDGEGAEVGEEPSEGMDGDGRQRRGRRSTDGGSLPVLRVGEIVHYQHRETGWILVKVIRVDFEGAFDAEGATYVIGGAPQLRGAEIETVRKRLFRKMPEWSPRGFWIRDDEDKYGIEDGGGV